MTVLFGHPTGTPFAHHAALSHFEAGRLESFCVPWMPSLRTLKFLESIGPLRSNAQRLGRRHFRRLDGAPKTQGRLGEIRRLLIRSLMGGNDGLTAEANDWLMRTMTRELRRSHITAVHAYEDCSLWQFRKAKRLGKACIYDMPIGYYRAWEHIKIHLEKKYADWMPPGNHSQPVRCEQKVEEMELADIVLAPSRFVADTIQEFHPAKRIALAPYGVDLTNWPASGERVPRDELTFMFVVQFSILKGTPLLLEAWRSSGIKNVRLQLVGAWQMAEDKQRDLPPNCHWRGPVSSRELKQIYSQADVFVFPTNFEGRALVTIEALASGLPLLTTGASGADDAVADAGRLAPADNLDALVEGLRWFDGNRNALPAMSAAARRRAEMCTWSNYRKSVTEAVRPYI